MEIIEKLFSLSSLLEKGLLSVFDLFIKAKIASIIFFNSLKYFDSSFFLMKIVIKLNRLSATFWAFSKVIISTLLGKELPFVNILSRLSSFEKALFIIFKILIFVSSSINGCIIF